MKLGDRTGRWSEEALIDAILKNDLEHGNVDIFQLSLPDMENMITELEIRRDSSGANDDWYADTQSIIKSCYIVVHVLLIWVTNASPYALQIYYVSMGR